MESTPLTALQTATRFSGRLSFLLFSVIFLFYFNPLLLRRWLSDRYYFLFAVVHGIHLIELLVYVNLSGIKLIPYRVAGGVVAYIFIFAMPWLAKKNRAGTMTLRTYILLENIYLFYVWFIFFMTYFSRVQGKLPNIGGTFAEHIALFGWVLAVLILHFIMRFWKRIARNAG
jgi:hypothetical protein